MHMHTTQPITYTLETLAILLEIEKTRKIIELSTSTLARVTDFLNEFVNPSLITGKAMSVSYQFDEAYLPVHSLFAKQLQYAVFGRRTVYAPELDLSNQASILGLLAKQLYSYGETLLAEQEKQDELTFYSKQLEFYLASIQLKIDTIKVDTLYQKIAKVKNTALLEENIQNFTLYTDEKTRIEGEMLANSVAKEQSNKDFSEALLGLNECAELFSVVATAISLQQNK